MSFIRPLASRVLPNFFMMPLVTLSICFFGDLPELDFTFFSAPSSSRPALASF